MKKRKDFFLIWGHGLKYEKEIINLINKNSNFIIKYFYKYEILNMNKFISNVYFNDYTPINHLKNKTKYLRTKDNKVLFIFIENKNPKEIKVKSFNKSHIESKTINKFKIQIRNKYNPKINNKITHDHVIHGSDSQAQTEHIIRFLSNKNLDQEKIYNQKSFNEVNQSLYNLKNISINKIKARILIQKGLNNKISTKIINLNKTPHYYFVKKNKKSYLEYIDKFRGIGLNYEYSEKKFSKLIKNLKYLKGDHSDEYINVDKIKNEYIITDGLHRASILKNKLIKSIIVKEKIY